MAALFFLLGLCSTSVLASPRNIFARGQKRNAGSGASGPPGYGKGTWASKSADDWGTPGYGGGPSGPKTVPGPPSSYGGGGDGWDHPWTCEASTVFETSFSTVFESASTVYVSGSGYTSVLPASTVYISGSELPASTVYISGSGYTSVLPASTVTLDGQGYTSITTAYETITQPAAPTTVYVTRQGQGWNRTITREETDFFTTTQYDVSTILNEETLTLTSLVTLPGEQ